MNKDMEQSASLVTTLIGPPFAWCPIPGGRVMLEDASDQGGTPGGEYQVADFWMARYPLTNAQYQAFIAAPDGFAEARWWDFSPQARQWHVDHPRPRPTAFPGDNLSRTRVSWFDGMAFCTWLSAKVSQPDPSAAIGAVRLPTEQEWQRAAVGDSGWSYPWGHQLDPTRANYGKQIGCPTPVGQYPAGQSPYGVLDLIGNLWEWCLNPWGKETLDLSGYTYRAMRGGAWNVSSPEYLRALGRYGHPPRGQLNDGGFRIVWAGAGPARVGR